MDYLTFFKYLGIAIAAISGITSLLGDPIKERRPTAIGYILIVSIISGSALAIIMDQLSSRKSFANQRIEREWSKLEEEKIEWIEISYHISGETPAEDFLVFVDEIDLSLTAENEGFREEQSRVSLRFVETNVNSNLHEAIKLCSMYHSSSNNTPSRHAPKLYRTKVADNKLYAKWTSKDAVDKADYICGISSIYAWGDLELASVDKIKNLGNLSISLVTPKDLSLTANVYGHYEPALLLSVIIATRNFHYRINPLISGQVLHTDTTVTPNLITLSSSIGGPKLLEFCRQQFFDSGGIKSDKIRKPNKNAKGLTGRVSYIEEQQFLRDI